LLGMGSYGVSGKEAQALVEVGFNVHADEEAAKLPVRRRQPNDQPTERALVAALCALSFLACLRRCPSCGTG
jgi:hypothetical protein